MQVLRLVSFGLALGYSVVWYHIAFPELFNLSSVVGIVGWPTIALFTVLSVYLVRACAFQQRYSRLCLREAVLRLADTGSATEAAACACVVRRVPAPRRGAQRCTESPAPAQARNTRLSYSIAVRMCCTRSAQAMTGGDMYV